jgi:1,4-dihydroxy-2-naphthoate octaprenyltransferase
VANTRRPQQKRTSSTKSSQKRTGRPGGQPPRVVARKATARDWIGGARLRTLPLAVAPVALGTGSTFSAFLPDDHGWHWVRALLALAVAVALQIGVNFANDYSDGIRGTDKYRVGPSRLTGSGAAKPKTVRTVAFVFFGLGGVAGLILVVLTQYWWLIAVGAVCIVAAYFYTGGKRPYGYYGLGELFVFVFFGIVATAGTTFTQIGTVTVESWISGAAAGLLACAVLMVNNIRDLEQDKLAGKRTLAVRLGNRASRVVFTVFVIVPFLILGLFVLFYPLAPLVYFVLLAAVPAIVITLTGKRPQEFIIALQLTSLTALVFGLGLGAAIAF